MEAEFYYRINKSDDKCSKMDILS